VPDAVKIMEENEVCSIVLVKNNKAVGIFTMKALLMDYAK
jgi:predicted transcriptional regulator